MLVLVLLMAATAGAQALAPGELYGHRSGWGGNAFTMPAGQYTVSALSRSAVGITRRLDVKAPLLGLVLGPKVSTELALVARERVALSVEPLLWFRTWGGSLQEAGVTSRASALAGPGMATVALTAAQVTPLLGEVRQELRLELNYEVFLSDRNRLIVSGRTGLSAEQPATGGVYFATASESVGVSLGVNVGYVDLTGPQSALGVIGLGEGVPSGTVLPMPHFQLWIRG